MSKSLADQVVAKEKRIALAVAAESQAREDARVRANAVVAKFAASFPDLHAEVEGKLSAMVADHVARVPAGDTATLAHIETARRNAYVATMLNAKSEFETAARGQKVGNRAMRRAAAKKA